MDNDTSLIVPVAAAAFLQPFREKYLHRPGVTMPPHITLRSPFQPLRLLTEHDYQQLKALFAQFPAFSFTLARLTRFADMDVLYLAPEPADAFLALYHALYAQYPEPVEEHDSVIFHLTLARTPDVTIDALEEAFVRTYSARLPIAAMASEVCLYEKREERWFQQFSFPLGNR